MNELLESLREFGVEEMPSLIVPLIVLLVGWVIALVLGSMTRRGLVRANVNGRIASKILGESRASELDVARWVGRFVYYIALLFTLLAFLQVTRLSAASEPVNAMLGSVLTYVPRLFAAAAILFVAWLVAFLTRAVLSRSLQRWRVDRHVTQVLPSAEQAKQAASRIESRDESATTAVTPTAANVSDAIAEAGYWLVFLVFLPAVLGALRLEGMLAPVQEMLNRALGFLPNIASALIIAAVGWLVARVVQRLITNTLASAGTDRLSARIGADRVLGKLSLSTLAGFIAYVLVLFPVAIGALNALQLEAITRPASVMLEALFTSVPAIFGAGLVLGLAYAVGRLLSSVVSKLLNGIGFDRILAKLGFARDEASARAPSDLIGGLVMIAVVYVAALEGARLLGFAAVVGLGTDVAQLAGHVLLGLVVFGVGLYLAKLAADAVRASDISQARVLAIVTRVAVLGLAGGVALRQMGIANEIIELAFGLILGAVAVAAAIAFGLGGRTAAARALDEVGTRVNADKPDSTVGSEPSRAAV